MATINETEIKTPGVYINEIPSFPPAVAQVATAIPAFIGYTDKAENSDGESLTLKPTKIYSLLEYEENFGTAQNETVIEVAVEIEVDSETSVETITSAIASNPTPSLHNMYYALRHFFDNGGGQCYIVSVGTYSGTINDSDLTDGLNALEAYDEPTIICFPEGQGIADPANYYALMGAAIDQCVDLQDRFTLIDVHTQESTTSATMTNFRDATVGFSKSDNLNYGAAYYPNLHTTYDYQYEDSGVTVNITTDGTTASGVTLDTLLANQGAVYYACIAAIEKLGPILPPTPAVAGLYAKVDGSRGVWKAPANVSVSYVKELSDLITDAEQATMNIHAGSGKSVNAIRAFVGKGILVWGARTLDGNSNEWRYVSVRRFFIMVEESAKKASFQFVFEPNDANTWIKIKAMIENYLTVLWRQGALAGAKPEHAFIVKVGLGETMTKDDILNGKLIVEIGMAAVRPAEFIILRFMHKMQES